MVKQKRTQNWRYTSQSVYDGEMFIFMVVIDLQVFVILVATVF